MSGPGADPFAFTTIAHRDHRICNPLSDAAVDEALGHIPLVPGDASPLDLRDARGSARLRARGPRGDAVLDVGCGKGEMLLRLVERCGVRALGVDRNPHFVEEARAAAAARAPAAAIEFRCGDARDLLAGASPFAAALCVGSTHAFGGYGPSLAALARLVRPGGAIVVGEGFWRRRPDAAYLAFLGTTEDELTSHDGNVAAAGAAGLALVHVSVASDADWDRYEVAYAAAVERHVAAAPRVPGAAALLRRIRAWRAAYLRWGRSTLGFGLYVFRR